MRNCIIYVMPRLTKKTLIGLKVISQYLGKYRNELIIISVLSVISAIANSATPYLVSQLLDAILKPEKIFIASLGIIPSWLLIIILWAIVRLISDAVDWIINNKTNRLENLIQFDYLTKGFSTLLELPISFHRERKMGEIFDRLLRASDWIGRILGEVIISLSSQFLSIFAALAISFYVNYYLAFVLILGVFAYIAILVKVAPQLANFQRKAHKITERAYGDAYDAILNIQSIKQATAENYEQKKIFRNFRIKVMELWTKVFNLWSGISFSQRLIITITQLAVFGLSIYFIQRGEMTIGKLMMFNGYTFMLFAPFVQLGHNWSLVQNGFIALERAEKILTTPKEIYLPKNAVILPDIKGKIEFENVFFAYKKGRLVLEEINFKVNPGEIIALVGESGVGKTTLIELISGYYFTDQGRVLIDGHNIRNLDLKFLRSKIAVVPQEIMLFNDTIKNNIKYGNFNASDEEIIAAAEKAHCSEFIENFPKKYEQIVGERGVKLSVGQKQRVAIARAILKNPKILILDEPTSALDAKSEKLIQESLEKLMRGRTTFIIAHRLSTIKKADRIFVFNKGRIVEEGKHDELIKIPNGTYRQLYELQIGLK